jgi:hypothetical protein
MKLETPKQDISVQGDFATSDYAVGDLAFIVDMFADKVYTYKERAIVRELSCNAHDSHVDAGNEDTNFDVHIPTHLEPWFSIRDYGVGLDDSEVRNIFAGIGISTKRNSNKTIGCFGIGSLSPYALCDSFTVKAWKDGICRTYSCYRGEDRKPLVACLSEEQTDEPNGVEVTLNIEGRVSKFEEEAINVFKWWDYTPNINNKNVIAKCDEWRLRYTFKGDDYALNPGWGDMVAIMGNIAYRIPNQLDEFNCDGYIKFELGEISFDTARENLSLDDKTEAAIKAKFERIRSEIADEAIAQIEAEDTPFKKAVLADKLRNGQIGRLVKSKNLSQFDLPEPAEQMTYWKRNYRSTEKNKTKDLPLGSHVEYYVHKDRMQTRIKYYLKEVAAKGTCVVILTDEQVDEVLLDRDQLKDLDDLPTVPRQGYTAGSTVKTFMFNRHYRHYDADGFWSETELEDNGQEMVYVEISRWKPVEGSHSLISDCNRQIKSTLETLEEHGIEVPVVMGLKSAFVRQNKFEKGNFIHLDDYVKREFGKITPKTFYKYDSSDADKMKALAKIAESDELTEFIELLDSSKNDDIARICKRIGLTVEMTEDTFLQEWMDNFFAKYEMLSFVSDWEISRHPQKVARYIQAESK